MWRRLTLESRLKILFIAPHLDGGGSERVLINLLNNIDRDLIESELLVFEKSGSLMKQLNDDIRLVSNKVRRPRYAVFEISKMIKENRYNVVFVMKLYMFIIVYLAVKLSGKRIPIVYREVTYVSTEICRNSDGLDIHKLYNNCHVYRFLYRHMSKIVVPSAEMMKDLCSTFRVPKEKTVTIHNPVDMAEIEKSCRDVVEHPWFSEAIPVIISAGRLVGQKNFEMLIIAFSMMLDKGYKGRLIILGKGEKRSELESLIEKLGVCNEVLLMGHERNPFKYIVKSSIFVLPSLWEGFPNVLLEAMACGTAVISTDCLSGPKEIIDNHENGLLIASNNAVQLCDAMIRLLDDEILRKRLGEAGRNKVRERYALDKIIPAYEELFYEYMTLRY